MPISPTPNTVRACMRYSQNGEITCNVFHIDLGTEPTVSLMTTLGAIIKGWWDDNLRNSTHGSTALQAIELVDVSTASDDGIIYTTGLPANGTAGGSAVPNNVTVVTKLLTGLTGRSRRGRKYFPGLSTSFIAPDQQHITSTMQGILSSAWIELINLLLAEGWKLVVNSQFSNGVQRVEGLNTEVISATTNTTLDSQRNRLPERGT